MPAMLPDYPKELTNAAWQKKKGTIAKMVTGSDGSGIGKMLDQLDAAYKKVTWDNFQFDQVIKGVSPANMSQAHIKEYIEKAKAEVGKTGPARKLASDVETAAKKVADEWAKNKVIPKSSVAAAKEVSDKAKALAFAMAPGSLGEVMKENVAAVEAKIRKQDEYKAKSVGEAKAMVNKMLSGLPKLKAPQDWNGFWKQEVRAVGTQLPLVVKVKPEVKPLYDKFKVLAADAAAPKDDKELKAKMTEAAKLGQALRMALA